MFPLIAGFVFLITSWTYCLRGWLAALMVNKRRRRTVVLCVTVGFVLISQLPNLLVNSRVFHRTTHSSRGREATEGGGTAPRVRDRSGPPDTLVRAHLAVPFGWPGYGAMTLRQGRPWPAVGAFAASCLLGGLGLARAYRMTVRFYTGAGQEAKPRPSVQASKRHAGPLLVEFRPPWLPDDTAALALATFRSLLRAPEMKMALIMPVVLGIGLGSVMFTRPAKTPSDLLTAFAGTVVAMVAAFATAPMMSNAFGLDRNGFRALVLLPLRRHHILLAKNLAFFPFLAGVALVLLLLLKWLLRISLANFLAASLQVPLAFLLFSLVCNLVAILAPYRLAAGTLQAKKPKATVFLAAFLTMLLVPVVMTPITIPPALQFLFTLRGWLPWLPVNLLATLALLPIAAWLYWLVLPVEGRLLQRREQHILRDVTEEVE
jgi:hypothetical protein